MRTIFTTAPLLALFLTPHAFAAKEIRNVPGDPFTQDVRPTGPLTAEQESKSFHLPPGFEMQLVAAEPDINKPVNMAFDSRGRLWVTSTREYPFPAQPGTGRDTIKILEDFAPDGRARKVTTFAEGLNIPTGIYPCKDGCIAFSIPNIYFFHDTDGDGKSDKRELLYGPYSYDRDTHGMTNSFRRGFDGWLYATHGWSNTSTITAKDGSSVHMTSGNTYRVRLDGSHIEQYAWGQTNPFGLFFDTDGNLYSADCHSKPIYQLLRGGYYEGLGKQHDGLGFAPSMMQHSHGSTGIAGVFSYDDLRWPAEFQHNFFVGNPVTSRINRDTLSHHGSSPVANEQPDFVSTADPWFRPVDLQLGPDGAVYVADFYNKIIGHYEVPLTHPGRDRERGRIWRIVYNGNIGPLPNLSKESADALVADLASPNITLRMLATSELTDRIGPAAVDEVKKVVSAPSPATQRIHAMWVLFRLRSLDDPTLAAAATDTDPLVRTHAMRILTELDRLSPAQHDQVIAALKDPDPLVRRCAADALGRHEDPSNIAPLLQLFHDTPPDDTHLLYTARMTLRNQLRAPGALKSLQLSEQDSALIGDLMVSVPDAHAAEYLLSRLQSGKVDAGFSTAAVHHVARYAPETDIPTLIDTARRRAGSSLDTQLASFKALQEGLAERGLPLTPAARAWGIEALSKCITNRGKGAPKRMQTAAELAATLKDPQLVAPLAKLLGYETAAPAARGAAAKALLATDPQAQIPALAKIVADAKQQIQTRELVAAALGDSGSPAAAAALIDAVKYAPGSVQLRAAQSIAGSTAGGETLLSAVESGKLSPQLLTDRGIQFRLSIFKVAGAEKRVARLTKGLPEASAELQQLIDHRRKDFSPQTASAERGAQVFATNCAACHQIDGKGATVGPQLDGAGSRGLDRLVEDVLDPNRNVDPAFRYSILELKDGTTVTGLQRREEGEVLVFADSTAKEIKVPKDQVKSRRETNLSLMPGNFADLIPEPAFNDLMAYLLSKHAAAPPAP